ncbi:hypothetical protein ACGF07_01440 [Kitasatospora sp. NPDC048194]|uniref:hypothetical protein n=1 Tax=Kitasatospora sp. NPDC048194 TaxID=3364045 RepID=UPI00371B83D7
MAPPSGGFGPPPASYGPVVPSAQPLSQPVPPVPQPVAQPQPQAVPQPQPVAQPQPVPQAQPVPQPMPPQPQPVQPMAAAPQWQQQPVPPQRVEPDWEALADRNEAAAKRKRRMKVIGIVAAVVVVGGLVAGGAVLLGKKDGPKEAGGGPTPAPTSGRPTPGLSSATPGGQADDPSKPIWEAATDPAPQDAGALFSATQVTINGATWIRTVVSLDQPCWDGNSTTGGLGKVLGDQGCQKVLRATYVSGDSAVTVGAAVFDHKIQAETAMKNFTGQLKGLPAPGAPAFCANAGCPGTHSSLGRYAYFTVEGSAKGGNAPDATASAAASGFAEHVKGQLLQRAKAAGSATPGSQGTPQGTPAATPTG